MIRLLYPKDVREIEIPVPEKRVQDEIAEEIKNRIKRNRQLKLSLIHI